MSTALQRSDSTLSAWFRLLQEREMKYWIYDGHETKSYTKTHSTAGPGLPDCYQGGPERNWHGPFATKACAERMAESLMRVESGECLVCRIRELAGMRDR